MQFPLKALHRRYMQNLFPYLADLLGAPADRVTTLPFACTKYCPGFHRTHVLTESLFLLKYIGYCTLKHNISHTQGTSACNTAPGQPASRGYGESMIELQTTKLDPPS